MTFCILFLKNFFTNKIIKKLHCFYNKWLTTVSTLEGFIYFLFFSLFSLRRKLKHCKTVHDKFIIINRKWIDHDVKLSFNISSAGHERMKKEKRNILKRRQDQKEETKNTHEKQKTQKRKLIINYKVQRLRSEIVW